MLLIVLLPVAVLTFHCEYDQDLGGVRKVEVKIQPSPDTQGKVPWVSNMKFFLFGQLGSNPDSEIISAGFYRSTGELVYKLVVNCGEREWKTVYKLAGKKARAWKRGTLATPCTKGSYDIVYELQNDIRGKFLFNGSPAEGELKKQYKMMGVPRKLTWTGNYRIEKLPVNLKHGTVFKASSTSPVDRVAYGKCFAFPSSLTNCSEAKEWVLRRSKIRGSVHLPGKVGVAFEGLGEYGAWSLAVGPTCNATSPHLFSRIQTSVMPDQHSVNPYSGKRQPYCCCTNSRGEMEGRCEEYNRATETDVCTENKLCPQDSF